MKVVLIVLVIFGVGVLVGKSGGDTEIRTERVEVPVTRVVTETVEVPTPLPDECTRLIATLETVTVHDPELTSGVSAALAAIVEAQKFIVDGDSRAVVDPTEDLRKAKVQLDTAAVARAEAVDVLDAHQQACEQALDQ